MPIRFPYTKLLKQKGLSERKLAHSIGVSRGTLRKLRFDMPNFNLPMLSKVASFFGYRVEVLLVPEGLMPSDCSSIAVALQVMQDGFDSWKIHYMNMVDAYRRTLDVRLLLLPPPAGIQRELYSLLASIVMALSEESEIEAPQWATKSYFLPTPWFVSGMESLKASAILESPQAFRSNNIFVMNNFLSRA